MKNIAAHKKHDYERAQKYVPHVAALIQARFCPKLDLKVVPCGDDLDMKHGSDIVFTAQNDKAISFGCTVRFERDVIARYKDLLLRYSTRDSTHSEYQKFLDGHGPTYKAYAQCEDGTITSIYVCDLRVLMKWINMGDNMQYVEHMNIRNNEDGSQSISFPLKITNLVVAIYMHDRWWTP
jgi:hypothetical protein